MIPKKPKEIKEKKSVWTMRTLLNIINLIVMTKKNNESDYLDSFIEYQGKQYLPGYYVGGKIDPSLKSKTKASGHLLLFGGVFSLILAPIFIIISTPFDDTTRMYTISSAILIVIVGILSIIAAKRVLRKNPKDKQR
ncbi:MAG: hypothetical protein Q7K55_07610 [Candidatus Levybacteria bacterium]|nr:hypothetical protein [Candidatus Levybacteria bacterium]